MSAEQIDQQREEPDLVAAGRTLVDEWYRWFTTRDADPDAGPAPVLLVETVRALADALEVAIAERDRAMDAAEKAIERGNEAATGWHASMDERARLAGHVTALCEALNQSDDALDWAINSVDVLLSGKPHRSIAELRAYVNTTRAHTREALAGLDEPAEERAHRVGACWCGASHSVEDVRDRHHTLGREADPQETQP